jgi:NTE family protein
MLIVSGGLFNDAIRNNKLFANGFKSNELLYRKPRPKRNLFLSESLSSMMQTSLFYKFPFFLLLSIALLSGCSISPIQPEKPQIPTTQPTTTSRKPVIGLALGGGAARGFAHIGVIKVLEANGIKPDILVGTSAGSVISAIYATGISGNELQRIAINLDEATITDWTNPFSSKIGGMLKGDALQSTVNQLVKNRPIDQMKIRLGIVATDLNTGNPILFQRGDTGQAVRASSSVPGVFKPTLIQGQEYVDGGLTSPVPIKFTRNLGADIVIAVNISSNPADQNVSGVLGSLLQTTTIMGRSITNWELPLADIVVVPQLSQMKGTDFKSRNEAILAGEVAMQQQIANLKNKIIEFKK